MSNDSILLSAKGNSAKIDLAKTLEEFSNDNVLPEQAIMIRFKYSAQYDSFEDTLFALSKGEGSTGFTFYNSKFPATGRSNTGGLFLTADDSNFELKQDIWCYAFITMDDYSNQSILIWHENEPDNMTRYFYRSIFDDIDQSHIEPTLIGKLSFSIEIGSDEAIEISDYWIFEYEVMKR